MNELCTVKSSSKTAMLTDTANMLTFIRNRGTMLTCANKHKTQRTADGKYHIFAGIWL